ncbi:hypothetical protein [Microbacterium sp. A93]|uniref:hypothetical protein n=1 Tax=Microbacterium sp. A93 TaxID=3450716 RepID=UPI003F444DBD
MTASWPGDSATVARWVRAVIQHAAKDSGDVELKGLDDITVTASLAGNDLEHLTLDATGVRLRLGWHSTPPAHPAPSSAAAEQDEPDSLTRESGIVKTFRFTARPMRIEQTPLSIDVQAFDVPIAWLTFAEPTEPDLPESIHMLVPDGDLDGLHGIFHATIATKDLVPLITSVTGPMLREAGAHLGRVKLDLTDDGDDGIRVTAYAGLRWKLLMASARADARIQVTRDAVITVRDLTVGSRNLFVKAGLLFARKRIRGVIGQTFDLNEIIAEDGTPTRLHDVRIETGDQLSVSARFR